VPSDLKPIISQNNNLNKLLLVIILLIGLVKISKGINCGLLVSYLTNNNIWLSIIIILFDKLIKLSCIDCPNVIIFPIIIIMKAGV
jgi:hypothetical protein